MTKAKHEPTAIELAEAEQARVEAAVHTDRVTVTEGQEVSVTTGQPKGEPEKEPEA